MRKTGKGGGCPGEDAAAEAVKVKAVSNQPSAISKDKKLKADG